MNLSIKNVSRDLVEQIRNRATRNHRSLQGELLDILEQSVAPRRLELDEARRRLRRLAFETGDESQQMIREDRDGR